MGVSAWFLRQPQSFQQSVQFVGVFTEAARLRESLKENWNLSFASFHSTPTPNSLSHAKPMKRVAMKSEWECQNCEMENEGKQSKCILCEKPKVITPSSFSDATIEIDLTQPPLQATPATKKKKDEEKEEAAAIVDWKKKQLKEETTTSSPVPTEEKASSETKEFNFIYNILSELNQEQVTKVTRLTDKEEQPRYLFALVHQPSRALLLDKVSRTVEWFDPFVPERKELTFVKDERTSQLQNVLQKQHARIYGPTFPTDIQEAITPVLKHFSLPHQTWTLYVNKIRNKQKTFGEASDLYALWYLLQRMGHKRSPEEVDKMSLSFQEVQVISSYFFEKN
jgi:hypothetical protein